MRIMALDIGEKRVGVALSDEMGWTAGGLSVIDRKPHADFLANIKALVEKHQVERVVLGLPRRMDGTLGPEAHRVLSLVKELERIDLKVETWDERLSTVAVERVLVQADMSRRKRKQVIDKVAATYILQGYLDYLSSKPSGE